MVDPLELGCRIRTVDQQLRLCRITGADVLGKLRWNLQTRVGATSANLARHLLDALHFADDAKCLRVHEPIDELPALDRAIFIENDERHVLHVGVERVAKCDHLHQRREKHEKQRHRITPNDDEFLEQNCSESTEGFALHAAFSFCSSAAYFALRVTKTSSSDGPISWISAWLMPTLCNFSSISARCTFSSTSRCIDWPKTVALRTPCICRIAWS